MDREQLDQMIAELEEAQRQAAKVLPHLRAARAALEDKVSAGSEPQKEAAGNGHSAKEGLFQAKYKKPGRQLVIELLRGLKGREIQVGLSRRGILEGLEAQGTAFSSQFIAYALKGLQEEGIVEKIPAPSEASAKWNFRLNPRHPGAMEGP